MKESKKFNKVRLLVPLALLSLTLAACSQTSKQSTSSSSKSQSSQTATKTDTSQYFTDRDSDPSYEESKATKIELKDNSATSSGNGASVDGSTVTISTAGTYIISGKSENVQILVKAGDQDKVQIVLNGVTMTGTDAGIVVESADKTFLTLAEGSKNSISDSAKHKNTDYDAAIYSKDDLTLNGSGSLTVEGNYGNAIESNDDLRITGGTYTIKGYKNALAANDALNIKDASLDLTATEDALHADNDDDTNLGNLYIQSGTITIKADDDGMHASNAALIDGGTIKVEKSQEALEGKTVTINGGELDLTSTDDGINASDGSSSEDKGPGQATAGVSLTISGGKVKVNAQGDGLDSNGDLTISGGEVYVDGPTDNGNGALDYDGNGSITGGQVMIIGSSGMAMGFGSSSTQASVLANVSGNAGSKISITDSSGKEVLSYTALKNFQSVLASSADLKDGETYTIKVDGQSTTATASLSTQNGNGGPGGGPAGGGNGGPGGRQ
ncbi:carbohydrate-binding domain-containing protein [Streptococcus oricebi]|uniref:Carbohydrate-binding domain-containing protein n=1 Tax=Streptococcus oricebi TaxID=1547447 RepID=A0ABS5B5P2_9STRE|nr:carbohydrate-binding domain-containing protein [Streptococcus oricebi]MBP2624163.1 hypothetical protein [Streptococcus oricebi]